MAEQPAAQSEGKNGWWKRPWFRWLVFLELLTLFCFAYVNIGGLLIEQTNHTSKQMQEGDQLHNMRLATEVRADLHPDYHSGFMTPLSNIFPHRTDGVVNPLWPWVTAWFIDTGHTIDEADMTAARVSDQTRTLFNRGRWFHLFMTLGFLVMLGIAACRLFSLPAACNLVLLGGLGALLPRAAYFQPEPLYYVLFFLTWVACVSALKRNSLWVYGMIGVLGGAAYMADESIIPLLAVFVGFSSLRCVWEILSARRRGLMLSSTHLWHWRNHLVGLVVLMAAGLMTIGPRLRDAHEKFGDPFFSYSRCWLWLDSPAQAHEWKMQHQTRESLTAVSPSERPSLANYWRTHSREEISSRLWNGTFGKNNGDTEIVGRVPEFFWPPQSQHGKNLDSWPGWRGILEWRGLYLGWLALILLALLGAVAAVPKAQHAGHFVFRHGTVTIVLFAFGSFAVYSLACGFNAPIAGGSGDRFMLALYLPLVFSLIMGAEAIIRRIRRRQGSPWITRSYLLAQWILFAALTWRVIEIIRLPKFFNE
ncbi:MAG: hypothetical protein K8R87_10045 [Verrucomicrobia bacterium]|nr:hypothetical protein [Verrucomicrobiota bacterium]